MADESGPYAARLEIDYPERLDRLSSFFRILWIVPIAIIFGLLTNGGFVDGDQCDSAEVTGGIIAGLFLATMLMILFQQRYPR